MKPWLSSHLGGSGIFLKKSRLSKKVNKKMKPRLSSHLGSIGIFLEKSRLRKKGKYKFYIRRNSSSPGRYPFGIRTSVQTFFLMRLEARQARVQQHKKREDDRAKIALGMGVPFIKWLKWSIITTTMAI